MNSGDQSRAGATWQLATFSAALRYDDIPADVTVGVKRILLDTLGAALAATRLGVGCREMIAVASDLGGKPDSTIFGSTRKVAAPHAAMANGALAHALNYDAIGPQVGHVGLVALTAPLAVAEATGGISGRDFLAAATVASEVTSRITAAQARTGEPPSIKFLAGQIFGYFGAAAGAGRVLGLTAQEMCSAFGIALMQASGTMQVVLGGDPPAKAVYAAFPNQGGVLAALLSRAGLGAEVDALEGPAGLYEMIYRGRYDADALTEGLGSRYLLTQAQFKPWPTSGVIHPFIEAAGALFAGGLRPSDIATVEVVGKSTVKPWCEPAAERCRPSNAASAANSIQYSVAKVLTQGELTLHDFTPQGLQDETTLAVTGRTSVSFDETMRGGCVRVRTPDGRVLEAQVETPLGHPSRPMSEQQLVRKFTDCCRHAAIPLPASDVDRLVETVFGLERLDDVARLADLANARLRSRDTVAAE
jgi:2-methylcitrate dehydratase PrpD